jgi:hypothetical protein
MPDIEYRPSVLQSASFPEAVWTFLTHNCYNKVEGKNKNVEG